MDLDLISLALAAAVPIVLIGGLVNRCIVTHESEKGQLLRGRGIGWQFIRFVVIGIGVPIIGLLAWKGIIGGDVAAPILAAAIGYAFGKVGKGE